MTDRWTIRQIEMLLEQRPSYSREKVAKLCGVSIGVVIRVANGRHRLQQPKPERPKLLTPEEREEIREESHYLPTPEEIRAACLRILERSRRSEDWDRPPLELPTLYGELAAAIED